MLIVVQRVKSASLDANGVPFSKIEQGLVLFVGIFQGDGEQDVQKAADKITTLRVFRDEVGMKNLSVQDIGGEVLVVPNFTVCAETAFGRRPDYVRAEKAEIAKEIFDMLCTEIAKSVPTCTGVFGANMRVLVENDGPVTVLVNTRTTKA